MLPNVPQFAVAYYGALRAGAVVVPMNVLLKEREVAFYLRDSGADVLFAWHEFAGAAHAGAEQSAAEVVLVEPGQFEQLLARCEPAPEVAARADDDTAVILYTSGTTGTPKGAELTHGNLARNVEVSVALFGLDADDGHAGRAAVLPRVRPDLRPERHDRRRRPADAAAALRRRSRAGDHRARRRDGLRGRADDVHRDARTTPERRTPRRSRSASRAAPRCRSR